MVLSKVVEAIPFEGNGVGGRMATAPHYSDCAMGWLTKELFSSQQEQEIFSALKHSNQILGHPPSCWMHTGAFSQNSKAAWIWG